MPNHRQHRTDDVHARLSPEEMGAVLRLRHQLVPGVELSVSQVVRMGLAKLEEQVDRREEKS